MKALEAAVRAIEKDGLVWGASKLVPVGFGVKKLQVNLVVEDDKVSLEELQEEIEEIEEIEEFEEIEGVPRRSLRRDGLPGFPTTQRSRACRDRR